VAADAAAAHNAATNALKEADAAAARNAAMNASNAAEAAAAANAAKEADAAAAASAAKEADAAVAANAAKEADAAAARIAATNALKASDADNEDAPSSSSDEESVPSESEAKIDVKGAPRAAQGRLFCSKCEQMLDKSSFSGNQQKKKQQRKCKACVNPGKATDVPKHVKFADNASQPNLDSILPTDAPSPSATPTSSANPFKQPSTR